MGFAIRLAGDGVSLVQYRPLLSRLTGAHDCSGVLMVEGVWVPKSAFERLLVLVVPSRLRRTELSLGLEENQEGRGSAKWGYNQQG